METTSKQEWHKEIKELIWQQIFLKAINEKEQFISS